jgi:2-dehydro-3-deoxy-D-arabinonate dehydratase
MLSKQLINESNDRSGSPSPPDRYQWFHDDQALSVSAGLGDWLSSGLTMKAWADQHRTETPQRGGGAPAITPAPVDDDTEVWASGVTYLRSREARMEESDSADIYDKVYDAERAELFFKSTGWRACGRGQPIRIRADSGWNVPEPEVALVINAAGRIVGYTAGNDMSSRDIEGANPLYLPQAKIYDGSCALGPGIVPVAGPDDLKDIAVTLEIHRADRTAFAAETTTAQMKRSMTELVEWLYREISFPRGSILMTGTGIVPPDDFSLLPEDRVRITVGPLTLENEVVG